MAAYAERLLEINLDGIWTDVTPWVVSTIDVQVGIPRESYANRIAEPGIMKFWLNNVDGQFSPGGSFIKGAEVRLRIIYGSRTVTKFTGTISSMDPDIGVVGRQRTFVICEDWLNYARDHVLQEIPVQSNRSLDDAVTTLLGYSKIKPELVLVENSPRPFTTVFDAQQKGKRLYGELNDIIMSEFGYAYMDQGGQRLHVESRDSRRNVGNIATLPIDNDGTSVLLKVDGSDLFKVDGSSNILLNEVERAEYTGHYTNLKMVHGRHVINEATFTLYPKRVDISLSILYTLGRPILIPELGTVEFNVYYRDALGGTPLNALSVTQPVITTDYLMFQNEDGTGVNRSANIIVTLNEGLNASGSGARVRIVNTGNVGWLTHFQIRGFAIYPYDLLEVFAEDSESQTNFGLQSLDIRQVYQDDLETAKREAERIVDIERQPRNVIIKAFFSANASDYLMKTFLFVDIGHLTYLSCQKPAMDGFYYVNGYSFEIALNNEITFEWTVKELPELDPIAIKFSGAFASRNAIIYGTQRRIAQLDQITISLWAYLTSAAGNFPFVSLYGGDVGWWMFNLSTGKIDFLQRGTPDDGRWRTVNDVLTAHVNTWVPITVVYDMSNFNDNDPLIMVDGSIASITEINAPSGVADKPINSEFIIGNMRIVGDVLGYNYPGLIKDFRIYNRTLSTDEIQEIHANENDYNTIPNGVIFQGPFVRSFRYVSFIDQPITPSMKVLDRIYETPGTVTYDTSSNSNIVVGKDPSATSY